MTSCVLSFALADTVYHAMLLELNNHFILISGESGADKTEASKKILQYYAVCCPETALLTSVRDKMLMSNPVLEVRSSREYRDDDMISYIIYTIYCCRCSKDACIVSCHVITCHSI